MSSKNKVFIILAVFAGLALAGISGVFAIFTSLAKSEFIPGDPQYLRDIYVVIDQTLSMGAGQRKEAKDVLQGEVLDVLGPGDRVSCYRISSNFNESADRVFAASRRLPKVPENVPGVSPEVLPDDLLQQLRNGWQTFSIERNNWISRMNSVSPPGGNFSDYLGALTAISERINDRADPNLAAEKWLLVIGDLKHEPVFSQPPAPRQDEKRRFARVNIYLIYPGGIHDTEEQQRIENGWRKYFTARGASKVNFISFDGFVGRFPETRVPGPRL